MSRFVLSFTLVVSVGLVGVALAHRSGPSVHGAEVKPAGARKPARIYGFPDRRGVALVLRREPTQACAGSQFRARSPEFVLWDDGTVVHRTPTYDFRRGRIGARRARELVQAYEGEKARDVASGCDEFWRPPSGLEWTVIERPRASLHDEVRVYGLARYSGGHADACLPCRRYRSLAELERSLLECGSDQDPVLTGLPVEVFLQHKSCGCRDHPEIAAASSVWPLPGPLPSEICGKMDGRLRLEDPAQIERLAHSIERSAAVIEGKELYTCFLRPVFEVR